MTDGFGDTVGRKAIRRLRARHRRDSGWYWLGMLGVIGWSVAVPTVIGVLLGLWLDREAPTGFSWVLSLLVVGLALGIFNAWYWVRQESEEPPFEADEESATTTEGPHDR